jgi:hypothetical protein
MTDPQIAAAQALAAEVVAKGRRILAAAAARGETDTPRVRALRARCDDLEHLAANPPGLRNDPEQP